MTEIVLMNLKYIPYSAYQVKTANRHQPIQTPLKYFDNCFDGCKLGRLLLVQNMAEMHSNCDFEFLMVEYRSVIITRRLYTIIPGLARNVSKF